MSEGMIIYLEINDWLRHNHYYLIPNPLKPPIRCTRIGKIVLGMDSRIEG